MTVEVLISILQSLDPKAQVLIDDNEWGFQDVEEVVTHINVKVGKGRWGSEPYVYYEKAVVIE